ncbi:aspartate-semialdehyde dehydrogenase [Pseudomonas sp. dw_358]|uniref:aspartate-semialdehyde dehydrogenase n=1 Tax=Pseudomonas sp. dw_358 TaxID=2720083 RepID=UPI001BD66C16|nr:aspartate-semialdehyde dehydrogenase [Pseudomonas sp. dw_358]
MLSSVLPMNQIAVTSQLDPAKTAPIVPPVAPTQPVVGDSQVNLRQRDSEESASQLREEQRRRQKRERRRGDTLEHLDPEQHLPIPGTVLNADNTVPVAPLIENEGRQGLWVDIQI